MLRLLLLTLTMIPDHHHEPLPLRDAGHVNTQTEHSTSGTGCPGSSARGHVSVCLVHVQLRHAANFPCAMSHVCGMCPTSHMPCAIVYRPRPSTLKLLLVVMLLLLLLLLLVVMLMLVVMLLWWWWNGKTARSRSSQAYQQCHSQHRTRRQLLCVFINNLKALNLGFLKARFKLCSLCEIHTKKLQFAECFLVLYLKIF